MNFIKKHHELLLSALIPALIMLGYFIYRGFTPFGTSSLLTVDMGQQYVAFYEYFRSTILSHPSQLFYSFSNGLGGDMFGTWTYYLLSPVNLVLLFFKKESVTTGILIITVLKYGLAGLTSALYLKQKALSNQKLASHTSVIGFSIAYSLMAFSIANQLNLFWLDAPILLPIIILGLDRLIAHNRLTLFVVTMSCMVIINYYFAYMIGIFTLLYFIWKSSNFSFKKIRQFIKAWILILIYSAVSWMPTLWALLHGKAQYTENNVQWNFEYAPIKMLTKLIPGTFSFKQMSDGLPNIYVGMFVLIAFIAYFFNKSINLKSRIKALVITSIFLLSFCFSPMDLIWHAMQFPWWYPYRFSFIFSFWVILIAFEGLIHPLKNQIIKPIVSALIVMLFTIYSAVTYLPKASDYLTSNQIQFGLIIFTAAMLFWVGFQSKNFNPLLKPILIIFMSIDLSINAIWSLNRISYVSQTEFATYSAAARQAIDQIKEKTNDFTRIGTNFSRTKNDPIQIGYNSGSSFNSNLETNMLKAMTALGQPTTSGNVSYMNGTLITDSLLSFKYWSFVDEQAEHSPFLTRSVRHDVLNRYQRLDSTQYSNSYLNQFALPLGLTTKSKVSNRLDGNDPLKYQSQLMQQVSGQSAPLFSDITNQAQIYFSNVTSTPTIKNGLLTKKNLSKSASVTFEFEPNNNNPIYITAGSQMSHDNADIFVNNQRITEDIDYEHPIVLSIADQAKGKKVRIQIVLKKQTMLLSDFSVAELNYSQFKRDYQQSKSNGLTNVKASGNHVTANLTVKKDQPYLFTSIPYSPGWRIKINGHKINSTQMANYFLGSSTKLNAGKYKVTLTYLPPLLTLGFSISLLGIIGWLFLLIRRKRH